MKNIGAKILKVMEAVKSVSKDGTNSFHKYKYATDAAIVGAIRKELIRNKLICVPKQLSCVFSGEMTTLEIEYTLLDVDSGETFVTKVFGQGKDSGDKGVYKAATGAEKYFYLKTFAIPTDDDPENDRKGFADKAVTRAPAGYKALAKEDPKAAEARIGEGFEVRNTAKGQFVFEKEMPQPDPESFISSYEQMELVSAAKKKNIDVQSLKDYLYKELNCAGSAKIKVKDYAKVYEWIITHERDAVS